MCCLCTQDISARSLIWQVRCCFRTIGLLNASSLLAILGNDLVSLPGVAVDARLDDAEREEGVGEDERDCKGCGHTGRAWPNPTAILRSISIALATGELVLLPLLDLRVVAVADIACRFVESMVLGWW